LRFKSTQVTEQAPERQLAASSSTPLKQCSSKQGGGP
jgi:hypothetical protein